MHIRIGLLAWLACASGAALAQDAASQSSYEPSYFAAAQPANALDMLERVPGFVIVEADPDVRGVASARGNVLVDGVRPGKREDIEEVLERIPASAVARIELIRGDGQVDMAGHRVLANIVRRVVGSRESAIELGAAGSTDGWLGPVGSFEHSRTDGEREWELAASLDQERDDDSGRGRIVTVAPGEAADRAALRVGESVRTGQASVRRAQPLGGGRLQARLSLHEERVQEQVDIAPQAGTADPEFVDARERVREREISLNYLRPMGAATTVEMLASEQRARLDGRERATEGDDRESFDESTRTGERILRVDLSHQASATLSFSASVENARNTLSSQVRLAENGVVVPVPGSQVDLRESRRESAIGLGWRPSARWTLEAAFRYETSRIVQSGDTPLSRGLAYLKPRAALRWQPDARNQLRASLSREVGQLDFADFVASASLDSDAISAGNAQLAPDKRWEAALAWQHDFGKDAAVTVGWTHDRLDDVIDRVPVQGAQGLFDAPGNIGAGRRDTLAVDLALPLDRIGLAGGRVHANLQWRRSRVTDPVTGLQRGISGENPMEGEIEFTQDLPRWRAHWGLQLEHLGERQVDYRFDERRWESEDAGWTAFFERRIGERWRWRLEASDLGGRAFRERREQYDGPRHLGTVDEVETRHRRAPGTFSLTVRRSTGG